MRHAVGTRLAHSEGAMTLASSAAPVDAPDPTRERLLPLKVKVGLIAFAIALFGFLCYSVGTNHDSGPRVLTGRAYVSPNQLGVTVNGRAYGLEITQNGLDWYDASGGPHEGGIPPCLQHPGYTWIRFGYAEASGLNDQSSWRVVTWVQCVDHAG